ncbi:MAG: ribosome biogenesis GTP-binding protein YihA/YsxC [Gemmatimonadaceae bacterium]
MSERSGDNPLVIRKLEFIGGLASVGGWRPEGNLPEIAFAGRSNVGKSSLLNRLVGRRSLARVSRTPGRTREINFFRVNDQFILADLPGYGYARVSKARKAEWRPLIEGYLTKTPQLAGVVQLLDMRHEPSDDDVAMLDLLSELEMPTVVVLTKSDKLSKKAGAERVRRISLGLGLDPEQTISFSATTGEGRDELAGAIVSALTSPRDA